MDRYDLIAIGGGTAGLVTAAGGAALGLKTALIERDALGGDCLWTGCVPSKALIASARVAQEMRVAGAWGLASADPHHVFRTVMERMRAARATVAHHDDPERFRKLGVDVTFGAARVSAPGTVTVDGRTLTSKRLVIATGALPAVPPIPGLAEAGYLTHHTAFDQNELPRRIAMLGGGPIGLEFAQVYRRLGAAVTVFEMLPQLLPREEEEAARVLGDGLAAEGIEILVGTTVERVERRGATKTVCARAPDGREVRRDVDEVFVATGRRPNTTGLGLEDVGVAVERGAVRVNDKLESTVAGIWAAGDVAGGPQFTHVAEYHAKLVLRNAIFPFKAKASYAAVPMVTYTDPEVARVGLTEHDARAELGTIAAYRYDLADLDRAIVDARTTGFVKIVTKKNGSIVGATIVAHGAGDLLMPIVVAMTHGLKLPKLSGVVYPYPTMVEGVKRTADNYYRAKLSGFAGNALRRVVQWLK